VDLDTGSWPTRRSFHRTGSRSAPSASSAIAQARPAGGPYRRLQALARLVESELERRVLERQRQEAVENFRDLAEVSAEWVWQTDAEHRLVGLVTNLPHMKKIGTTRVGTRRWEQVNARALSCGWEDHIADLEARREFCGFEYEGNGFASRVSGWPRFDTRGRFLGYRGTGIDITARQRAAER